MLDFNVTAFIQAVNFFIAVIVLNYLLIRPIRDIIKQRKAKIGDMLASTEAFTSAADAQLTEYQSSLSRTRQEAALARANARSDALREQQELVAEAGRRAQEQLAQAKESLLKEMRDAKAALTKQVKPLASKAADKVLG